MSFDKVTRSRTATHEAGCAAVAHALGLTPTHMQLFGESSGFTDIGIADGHTLSDRDVLLARGVAAVAGDIAVELVLGAEAASGHRPRSV